MTEKTSTTSAYVGLDAWLAQSLTPPTTSRGITRIGSDHTKGNLLFNLHQSQFTLEVDCKLCHKPNFDSHSSLFKQEYLHPPSEWINTCDPTYEERITSLDT